MVTNSLNLCSQFERTRLSLCEVSVGRPNKLRNNFAITQEQIAKELGIDVTTIQLTYPYLNKIVVLLKYSCQSLDILRYKQGICTHYSYYTWYHNLKVLTPTIH